MVNGLLDTNVVIDLLRAWPPALDWLADSQGLGVSSPVWLEVLQGAPNKAEQRRAYELLTRFALIEPLPTDFAWAIQAILKYGLSQHILGMDALIAAPCARLRIPLYTHNLKHFVPMLGDLVRKPY
jgi:predicted nucleic acid-binding protein